METPYRLTAMIRVG